MCACLYHVRVNVLEQVSASESSARWICVCERSSEGVFVFVREGECERLRMHVECACPCVGDSEYGYERGVCV